LSEQFLQRSLSAAVDAILVAIVAPRTHRNTTNQPKYGQNIKCSVTTLIVFLFSLCELRHSLDLALLTKWPVFLQNAFGNPTYVNQANTGN